MNIVLSALFLTLLSVTSYAKTLIISSVSTSGKVITLNHKHIILPNAVFSFQVLKTARYRHISNLIYKQCIHSLHHISISIPGDTLTHNTITIDPKIRNSESLSVFLIKKGIAIITHSSNARTRNALINAETYARNHSIGLWKSLHITNPKSIYHNFHTGEWYVLNGKIVSVSNALNGLFALTLQHGQYQVVIYSKQKFSTNDEILSHGIFVKVNNKIQMLNNRLSVVYRDTYIPLAHHNNKQTSNY